MQMQCNKTAGATNVQSLRGASDEGTRNLEIPGSMLRIVPE